MPDAQDRTQPRPAEGGAGSHPPSRGRSLGAAAPLRALLASLGTSQPEQALLSTARAAEVARSAWTVDPGWTLHHGVDRPELWTTAFELHAGALARAAGVFAWERTERAPLERPAAWDPAPPAAGPRRAGPGVGPLDAPLADVGAADSPKAWSAGLVRALLPVPWWPDMDVWELAACARLREAVVGLHWYWLAELDRAYCPRHGVGELEAARLCVRCSSLARDTADAEVRAARLDGEGAAEVARNALDVLRYEVEAFAYAVERRELLEPTRRYLELGPALSLARREHPRVVSAASRRWVGEVLRPGLDYAPDLTAFAAGVAGVLERLLLGQGGLPGAAGAQGQGGEGAALGREGWRAQRVRRVLRDVGWRLTTWGEVSAERGGRGAEGEDGRKAVTHALGVISEALGALSAEAPAAAARALAEAAEAVGDGPARACLAVGYAPTPWTPAAEPVQMRAARAAALIDRLDAARSPLAWAVRYAPEVAAGAVARPRTASLAADLRAAVADPAPLAKDADIAQIYAAQAVYLRQALFEWLVVAAREWAGPEGAPAEVPLEVPGEVSGVAPRGAVGPSAAWETPWWYELAEPPDALDAPGLGAGAEVAELLAALGARAGLRVRPNPTLSGLPAPFDVRWVDDLVEGRADGARQPKYAVRAESVAVGRGRRGPVFVPLTGRRRDLLRRLRYTPTVAALLEDGVRWETLRESVARELVLCVRQRDAVDLAPGGAGAGTTELAVMAGAVEDGGAGGAGGEGEAAPGEEPGGAWGVRELAGAGRGANPWDDPAQAEYYAAFCDRWPVYDVVARALVERAGIGADAVVADLGTGAGARARAILEALGAAGRVVGVDPSPLMVEHARARLVDERLELAVGDAHALLDLMPLGPGFDAVVASSSFWLDADVPAALRAVYRVLRAGGVLALSLPAGHLGLPGAGESPGERAAAAALADLLGPPHPGGEEGLPEGLGSTSRLTGLLERVGFVDVEVTAFVHETTAAEYVDWLGQPAVLGPRVRPGGATLEGLRAALERAVEPSLPVTWRWALVRARVPR